MNEKPEKLLATVENIIEDLALLSWPMEGIERFNHPAYIPRAFLPSDIECGNKLRCTQAAKGATWEIVR